MSQSISVIGAGSIGVSTALHLQQRGWQVTLVDRLQPGRETSYGNAGIINSSSMVPLNSPSIHKPLMSYLKNDKPQLRYKPGYVIKRFPWVLQFLKQSKSSKAERSSADLYSLTSHALDEHKAFMQRAGNLHRLSELGWLRVMRRGSGINPDDFNTLQWKRFDIPGQELSADDIHDLEPALNPIYASGYLLSGSASVNNPGALVDEYARQFVADGGTLLQSTIKSITHTEHGFECQTDALPHHCEKLVVAAGPWSDDILDMLGYSVQLGVERGYHMHFNMLEDKKLNRSVYDVQSGFIMSPMEQGLRITSGVELDYRDAPQNLAQLEQVTPSIHEAIELGDRTSDPVWKGNRPTMPDSKPCIGPVPDLDNAWVAFGHQHIGLMTGPVTGRVLAEQISGEKTLVDLQPFAPSRYIRSQRRRKPVWAK